MLKYYNFRVDKITNSMIIVIFKADNRSRNAIKKKMLSNEISLFTIGSSQMFPGYRGIS